MSLTSYNVALKRGDTTLAEVLDLRGPALGLDAGETTSHDNANAWGEHRPGLLGGDDLTLTIAYVPANATHDASTGIVSWLTGRAIDNYSLVFPDADGTTWAFAGMVTRVRPTQPVNGMLTAEVTIRMMAFNDIELESGDLLLLESGDLLLAEAF